MYHFLVKCRHYLWAENGLHPLVPGRGNLRNWPNNSALYGKGMASPVFDIFVSLFSFNFSDIEPDFREQLQVLVPMVLAPENIVLKEINGSVITAQELVEYFKVGAQNT